MCGRSCTTFCSLDTRLLKLRDNSWEEGVINWIPKYVSIELGVHEKDVRAAISFLVCWSSPMPSMLDFQKVYFI